MVKFRIWNEISGLELGTYQGSSRGNALDSFAKEAGYVSYLVMNLALRDPYDDTHRDDGLRIEEIEE